ncbi:pyruvate ferredoxin oxidoreductase [Xiamenia xianingshaonis]|uniref:Pyruvate ferredoxin oxidoreductase n=1 Tax=Xiamenia xianingshaonis TaxID=2682776 RepID=A0A9E6MPF3_9ACTN|nr:pyruvate ferredoxin oxidoreductase [Xiamenia xianingshaonis]NHM14079.1 pyruvate ferredoxin oxidoreductase [Xiamenia xianingshaonis]QTU83943.1 pyruvate ferredoxin oxidoreductase [Xiamenia xianingshaonis]
MKRFLSGDEAFAEGVRLARPQVISAYPITPQTVVVERLSEMVEDGSLDAEYVHVESEHSALSCAIGASATGARTFTATSSQGLLYMAECLTYAAGGRFPIVMMNATRATALPWNIYGDQRDSLSLLDHGWIQVYAQDNQEALDLALMAYALAEDPRVSTPVMVNLDGFTITHTYENVDVPDPAAADAFLPPYDAPNNRFDFDHPVNIGYSAGPEFNRFYKYWEHRDMLAAASVVDEVESRFAEAFGRQYPGLVEAYRCDDADFVVVTLGATAGLVRGVVDALREEGVRAGMARIRYMRPFPARQLVSALAGAKAAAVIEQDISFGAEGTVFTNVNSALHQAGCATPTFDFIGGLGGDDITQSQVRGVFATLAQAACDAEDAASAAPRVSFLGIGED